MKHRPHSRLTSAKDLACPGADVARHAPFDDVVGAGLFHVDMQQTVADSVTPREPIPGACPSPSTFVLA